MRKGKRLVSAVLTVAMLVMTAAGLSTTAFAQTFSVDTLVECEDGELNNDIETVKDAAASGGAYIVASTGERLDDPAALSDPDAAWEFDIPSDGSYTLFMRAYIPGVGGDSGSDSFHFRWDDGAWQTIHPGGLEEYHWVEVVTQDLTAGKHTFSWTHREVLGQFDALFVTTDKSKLPADIPGDSDSTPRPTASASATNSPPPNDRPTGTVFEVTGNGVGIEAEDGVLASKYEVYEADDASGGEYIMGDGEKPASDPAPGSEADVYYTFQTSTAGSYTVWARVKSIDEGRDSVYAGLDGNYAYFQPAVSEDWQWVQIASGQLDAGQHSLDLIMREAKMEMDRFIITDKMFTPSGMGEIPDNIEDLPMTTISGPYEKPPVNPPAEHPRLLFRQSDIPEILENMDKPQNQAAKERYEAFLADTTDGVLAASASGGGNINNGMLNIIEAHAFNYALTGDETSGNMAVDAIINYLSTVSTAGNATRGGGYVIYVASEVYDWCYPLLDAAKQRTIITQCEKLAGLMEIGWPPTKQGAVTSHAGEAQLQRDLLSFAIAIYDERPDVWDVVAGRYYQDFVPVREFQNTAHYHHQGDSYGTYRHGFDTYAQILITQMGLPAPLDDNLYQMLYGHIYLRRPDGQLLRDGDTFNDTAMMWNYWNIGAHQFFMDSAMSGDPYLKDEFFRENAFLNSYDDNSPIMFLVLNDPDLAAKPIYELPLSRYFGSPIGMSVARTGWEDGVDSPAVVAQMKVGEWWFANHQHLDAGHFQLYYKGILASDSGIYEGSTRGSGEYGDTDYGTTHDLAYNKRTIAHNTITVYDPNETDTMTYYSTFANDGGQRTIQNGEEPATLEWMQQNDSHVATVEAQEIGEDTQTPAYTYLKGDLTNAYTDKVEDFKRSFMFLNLFNDDVPAALIVFDKVDSSNPSFEKKWLLHGLEEPEINGSQTIFRRTYADEEADKAYNGKMTVDTLLPAADNLTIEKVGGEGSEYMVDGTNYYGYELDSETDEGETWRIEVSPAQEAKSDLFLNVMQVSDNDKDYYLETELIETDVLAGVKIADRVVTFAKSGTEIADSFTLTVSGEGELQYTLADVTPGTWTVSGDGFTQDVIAAEEGKLLSFTAPAGSYTLTYKDSNANKQFINTPMPELEGVYIRINRQFLYSDVAPTVVNDRTLVPMRAIFEALGADVQWDEASATATATLGGREVTITENQTTTYVDGAPVEIDVPATIYQDRFVVPIRFISESFGAQVSYDEFARTVYITPGETDMMEKDEQGRWMYPCKHDIPNALNIYDLEASADDGEGGVITNSVDGDMTTRWAAEGMESAAWAIYDLGDVKTLDQVQIAYYNGDSRVYTFSIAVSEDGENYTTVLEKQKSSGTTTELEAFDLGGVQARYVKYMGDGNTVNMWNSVNEIVFTEKK